MNIPEFNEWAERIIKAAELPTKNTETQRFALASMILQTAPHDFFRPDEYYVNLLRKAASDQLATQVMADIKAERLKRQEEELKQKQSEATQNKGVVDEEKGKC
jgi:hypothetical protein